MNPLLDFSGLPRFDAFKPEFVTPAVDELLAANRARIEQVPDQRRTLRKTLIVALARKLLIALWRMVTTGEMPAGVVLRPAA